MADCPADGEWLGIRFKLGTFLPHQPASTLRDRSDVTVAGATRRSFWLGGYQWEYPDFENAETFVTGLAQAGLLAHDPSVEAALRGELRSLSRRSVQRRFLYYDQAHLTRSLKYLIGETPARIVRAESQLSFLYKTTPPR